MREVGAWSVEYSLDYREKKNNNLPVHIWVSSMSDAFQCP